MNLNECWKDCPWAKKLAFLNPNGLLTFQEFFKCAIEGMIKRDSENQMLRKELDRIRKEAKRMFEDDINYISKKDALKELLKE